jgi:hypothetical protein
LNNPKLSHHQISFQFFWGSLFTTFKSLLIDQCGSAYL